MLTPGTYKPPDTRYVTAPGPGQAFRNQQGELLLYVRREVQDGSEGVVLAGVGAGGVIFTRFYPSNTEIPAELVNDTAGRAEAALFRYELACTEHEVAALTATMKQAVELLSPSQAEHLRAFYFKRLKAEAK